MKEDIFDNYNTAKEVFKVVHKKNKDCILKKDDIYPYPWIIEYL